MRIAVNTRFLQSGRLEGIGLYTHEVLSRMVKQHPADEFIFFFDRRYNPVFLYGENVIPVVLFPPARHPLLFVYWFELSVRIALQRYKPDVFLSPDNFLCLTTPVPTVLVTHDLAYLHDPSHVSWAHRLYYRYFSPRFNRRADHIIAVSEFTKSDLIKQYDLPTEKITVAGNGCREIFRPLQEAAKQRIRQERAQAKPYFLYVGAVHPRKNVDRLITAFDRFKEKTRAPHLLIIAGRLAWQTDLVMKAWKQARCQADIQFTGYLPDEVIADLLGAAFALVWPSLFEGFGVPLLEAMHCEIPIITSNVASMPEVAGQAALLVDPLSVDEIAAAMEQLWWDEPLQQTLVQRGIQQRQMFTWEKTTEVVYRCLEQTSRCQD